MATEKKYPNQKEYQVCSSNEQIWEYTENLMKEDSQVLCDLLEYTFENMHSPGKTAGKTVGKLLRLLISLTNPKSVLELGTFSGYTALCMAEAMPNDGILHTCDLSPLAVEVAQSFFDKSPHGKKIKVYNKSCFDLIEELPGPFDFVFLDADKRNYMNYFKLILPKVKVGGLIVVDNALWMGNVLAPESPLDKSIAELNQYIADDDSLENVFLIVRDGLNIVRKIK
jgi:caffeoyl-CoA O-methyltransferase